MKGMIVLNKSEFLFQCISFLHLFEKKYVSDSENFSNFVDHKITNPAK